MTYDETLMLMAVMKAAYPEYYRGMRPKDAEGVVALWTDRLKLYPYEQCDAAVRKLIDECKFAPKISEVIEYVKAIATGRGASRHPLTDWQIRSWAIFNRELGIELPVEICELIKHRYPDVPLLAAAESNP